MPACPICNSNHIQPQLAWKKFTINRCDDCHTLIASPLPSDKELIAFYQGFLFKQPEDELIDKQLELKTQELKHYFGSASDAKNKSFLDFGGGTGLSFAAAKKIGWKSYYNEIDQEAISFVKEKFDLTSDQLIHSLEQTDMKFDYILSDNVIEHVRDPIAFVQLLRDHLNPNGVLVIKTPHAFNTSLYFYPIIAFKTYFQPARKYNPFWKSMKVFRSRIWHCDPPRHLFSFSKKSFQMIAGKTCQENDKAEVLFYNIPLFEYSVTKSFFSKDKRVKGVTAILIRIIALPVLFVEWISKMIQLALRYLKILTPGGIVLKIRKG